MEEMIFIMLLSSSLWINIKKKQKQKKTKKPRKYNKVLKAFPDALGIDFKAAQL